MAQQTQLPNFFTSGSFFAMQSDADVLNMGFGQEYLNYRLIQKLATGAPLYTNDREGKYRRLRRETPYISFNLQSAGSASGANLLLTVANVPVNHTLARKGDVIYCVNTGVQGWVTKAEANLITIAPMDATVFGSGAFPAGAVCRNTGNISANLGSRGTEPLNFDLTEDIFLCSVMRETAGVPRRLMGELKYVYMDKKAAWQYTDQQVSALCQLFNRYTAAFWQGKNTTFMTPDGVASQSFGVDYGIAKDGEIKSIYSQPSRDQFEDMIQDCLSLTSGSQELFVGGGDRFVNNIRAIYEPYLVTAGINNTFNVGAGEGINFTRFPVGRAMINLDYIPFYCNGYQGSAPTNLASMPGTIDSNTGYIINLTKIPTKGGGMVDRMQPIWWSDPNLQGSGSKICRNIPGMVGYGSIMDTGTQVKGGAFDGLGLITPEGYQNTSSSYDGAQSEFLLDGGNAMNMVGSKKLVPYGA